MRKSPNIDLLFLGFPSLRHLGEGRVGDRRVSPLASVFDSLDDDADEYYNYLTRNRNYFHRVMYSVDFRYIKNYGCP